MKRAVLSASALLIACTATTDITSFQECVDAGNPVMESYPRQCRTEDGQLFVEEVGGVIGGQQESQSSSSVITYNDVLRVTAPEENAVVSSPVLVEGEARGQWYFEATFPVLLEDADGNVLVESYATADGDWMTEDYVPFSAELEGDIPDDGEGVLVLKKSNASGLPEHDDELRIPVQF